MNLKSILIVLVFACYNLTAQTSNQFRVKLNQENFTLCEAIDSLITKDRDFKYYSYKTEKGGVDFYSISKFENISELCGNWTYVIRNKKINQFSFVSNDYEISRENFDKLNQKTIELIDGFRKEYGIPINDDIYSQYDFDEKNPPTQIRIIKKAMWYLKGERLKIDFSIVCTDEVNKVFSYSLKIIKFKDYMGSQKIPKWWDGY